MNGYKLKMIIKIVSFSNIIFFSFKAASLFLRGAWTSPLPPTSVLFFKAVTSAGVDG